MSFSQTFAFAVARAVDVATASAFTKHLDCTISSECDVALDTHGSPFLQKLGRFLNWIQPATATEPCHTRGARLADLANAAAVQQYLALPK